MSDFLDVTISDADVMRLFDRLESQATDDAINGALQAAARVVYRNAQSELLRRVPGADYDRHRGPFRDDGAPVDNIRSHYDPKGKSVEVHIRYDARLRWFEAGTVERWTKLKPNRVPAYRGRIPATFFFSESFANSKDEVMQAMLQSLDQYFKNLDT